MSKASKQAGFTIVELMIATIVFSVILLLVTYGIIQIGNRYYKSVLQTQTQTAARNAVDEIARGIQFSDGKVAPDPSPAYCINGIQYAARLQRIQGKIAQHVLVVRPAPSGCAPPDDAHYFEADNINSIDGGRDLLSDGMRVVDFQVNKTAQTGVYNVKLRVASGESELLCSPSAPGGHDCSDTTSSSYLNNNDLICKPQTGSTYCAVSELSTFVKSRLAP